MESGEWRVFSSSLLGSGGVLSRKERKVRKGVKLTRKGKSEMKFGSHELKRSWIVWSVDVLCAVLMVGCVCWVTLRYGSLPDKIPIHYNAQGVIDGYGAKSMIWWLVAIMWILIGFMSTIEQFPKVWNSPVKITDENCCRLLPMIWNLVSTTKLIVACLFSYIIFTCVKGVNLPRFFLLAVLTAIGLNTLFWTIRLILKR